MNDSRKDSVPALSIPPAVSSASAAQCADLLNQWGTGACIIPTSKPYPTRRISLAKVTTISMAWQECAITEDT